MRVLITSVPGLGHVNPLLPLAHAFQFAGHTVRWATGADAVARLVDQGIDAVPCGLNQVEAAAKFDERYPELADLPRPQWPDFMFPRLFGAVRARPMAAAMVPMARAWAPDLVVSDAAELAGPLVAAVLGVPGITQAFGALVPPARVAAAGQEVAGLWAEYRLDPPPHAGSYQHLYLDLYPPSLQLQHRPHVAATQRIRPAAPSVEEAVDLPALVTARSDRPLVYVTLGTVFANNDVLSTIVAGLAQLAVRVAVTVGPDGDPDGLGPQPENVCVARYIPQDALLSRSALVVSHAGSGTFLAALAHGLPQLCVPQAADQFVNAAAGAGVGCALAIQPGQVSIDAVAAAAERLLADQSFRAAAARLQDEIAAMPSPETVVHLLADRFG